ncbi:arabinogalactan oligomer/maltooligosaccharide transport system substrate-binding protein [Evansella vedderi]|uniref:Maltodextrin-binding protein n=1 Tax=Evansella vedderi TaxID=38282 RepID=A0ABT9ZWV7_9BACI|nr:extracellular solute-binding protein [Evansella vedderi]MDQ0254620.1 arabinogalactan oligomer/maltooligosaccharide transport system substrate-binding protein [Evansella vedderi]
MFKKSTLLLVALLLALVTALAACGPDREEEPPADTGADTDTDVGADEEATKPESLTIWANDSDNELDLYEELGAKYTEKTGIEVEIVPFSMLEQVDALSLDAPAGRGPDLFFQPHDMVGNIYLQGLAAELELTEEQLAGYPEGAIDAFFYNGHQLGIPVVTETYALFYNTDLVPDAPQTMDELMEIAANLTNASQDEYGFLMEATNFYFAYPFLTGPGGYVFGTDEEGSLNPDDIGLAKDGAVQGAELIQSWFENGYMPRGINGDIMSGLFRDGKVGAVVTGPWSIQEYRADLGDSFAIAPLPTVDGEPLNSFSGVKGWMVSEYSEHKDWATDLALFFTNAENAERNFELTGELPARVDVEIDDELRAAILEQAQHAIPMPNIPEMGQVWEPMGDALEFISQGDDAREVLEEAVEQIIEQIELTRAGQ